MTKPNMKTDALLDGLFKDRKSQEEILGDHGLLKSLTKWLAECALNQFAILLGDRVSTAD